MVDARPARTVTAASDSLHSGSTTRRTAKEGAAGGAESICHCTVIVTVRLAVPFALAALTVAS